MERRIDVTKIIFPFFLLLCISTSLIPLILAYDLITLDNYDAFIALLDKFYIPMSYFTKVIIHNLDYINFNIFKLLASLVTSLSYMNVVVIVLLTYLWAASKETYMRKRNKAWRFISVLYLSSYLLIALILIFGFQLTSLNTIMTLFFNAGIVMFIAHIMIIMISFLFLLKEIKQWIQSYHAYRQTKTHPN